MRRNAAAPGSTDSAPQLVITMAHGPHPEIEHNLRSVFGAITAAAPSAAPEQIAAQASDLLGRGTSATLEAERGPWSRYRIAVRVQGMPVTIATVELTLPG
ncbi:MAG TPA: hypothetical protein VFZ66_07375 [Herpetosiphonaceae bacterium]